MSFRFDPSKSGLRKVFKVYEVETMRFVWGLGEDGVSIALYPRTLKALDDYAAKEGRTRSGMVERILSRYFRDQEGELEQDERRLRCKAEEEVTRRRVK